MLSAPDLNVSIGEEMYRRIVEAVPEGIWVVDSLGSTVFSNRRMAEILGIDFELMPAQSCFDCVFPEELADALLVPSPVTAGHSIFAYAAATDHRYGSAFLACLSTTRRVLQ